jgi:hypothetical protein
MDVLELVKIEKRLCVYGTSSSPVRRRGAFDCLVGGRRFAAMEVFEGHSNNSLEPVRLLAIRCSVDSWELDATIASALNDQQHSIHFELNGQIAFTFEVRRVSTEIQAVTKQCDILRGREHTGLIRCNGQERGSIRIRAPDYSAECLLYLYGDDSMLADVARRVNDGNECIIVMADQTP